jgi:hypothetical protein
MHKNVIYFGSLLIETGKWDIKRKPEKELEYMVAAHLHAVKSGQISKSSGINLLDYLKKNKSSYSDMLHEQSQELKDIYTKQETQTERETSFAATSASSISSPSPNLPFSTSSESTASSVSPVPRSPNPVTTSKAPVEIDTDLIKKFSGEMKTNSNLTIAMYDYGGQEVFYSITFYSISWYLS